MSLELPADAQPATVVVVDPDGVSRRFIELALGGAAGFRVEAARGAAGALELLSTSLVELVVTETRLEDMDGLAFLERLNKHSRLRDLPVIFLSADGRVGTKVAALRAGAADYLLKPVDAVELATRAAVHVGRRRAARAALLGRRAALAGSFTALPMPDLVNILHFSQATGSVQVETPSGTGRLVLDRGRLLQASFGNLDGRSAFFQLLREPRGWFEYELGAQAADATRQLIDESPTSLLLEGTRLLDESRRSHPVATAAPSPAEPTSTASPPRANTLPAGSLEVFAGGIAHAFSLGEIRLHTAAELAAWCQERHGARLHNLLVADLESGLASMMALASPPGERELLAGLAGEPRAVSLTFALRSDHLFDVVLLDIRSSTQFLEALTAPTDALVLAPPEGNFLSLGATDRAGLVALIRRLTPRVLVGLGNVALAQSLAELGVLTRVPVHVEVMWGALGDGATDLRRVLLETIRCRVRADASSVGGGA